MRSTRVLLVLAAVAHACSSRTADEHCRRLGDGTLRSHGVEVRIGSRVFADGTVADGESVRCGRVASATSLFVTASGMLSALPERLRPRRVVVHHAPALPSGSRPVQQLEMHRPSRSLLASGSSVPRSVLLHELAHLRMLGARPIAPIARRLLAAVEEGIADYYAAVILQSPRLVERSLDQPPRILADDWVALASTSFDPHRLGWRFGAMLWASQPRMAPLLEDLVDCMTRAEEGSADARASAAIGAWLERCPERSRTTIRSHVCNWLPPELASACGGELEAGALGR